LFIGGADTTGRFSRTLHTLAAHVPGARVEMIPDASHMMFEQDPVRFSIAVLEFLASA
jgi:pimeloyl-ACP methyl ester carboxylesterase